ncbi:glycine receptor subunit alpha-3-like [Ptychodera flava]|uniref:glycine receptor subunit alpha-3-like n=1 Tax=Ptychodera flava TaxID=63121 RepID=UPI003969D6DC
MRVTGGISSSWTFFLTAVTAFIIVLSSDSNAVTSEGHDIDDQDDIEPHRMLDSIMLNYDRRFRPNVRGPAVTVVIDIFVSSFDSVEEATMDYGVVIFLRQRWQDPRLQFNDTEPLVLHGEYANQLWQPDLFLPNEKGGFLHDITTENRLLRMYPDGNVLLSSRYSLTLACIMDLERFPFDDQVCEMRMESYGYTTNDVIFEWSEGEPVQTESNLKLPQFKIARTQTESCTKEYITGTFTCIRVFFYLERDIGYYVLQAYLPSILLVVLSWVSFWISYDAAPARVALGVTTILTMTTLDSGIRATLPKVAYAKAIDIWMAVCQVFVFGALVEFAVVNYVHVLRTRRRRQIKENSIRLSSGAKDNNGFEMESSVTKPTEENGKQTGSRDKVIRRKVSRLQDSALEVAENGDLTHRDIEATNFFVDARTIDRISQFGFPIVFAIFNLIYWLVFIVFVG